MINRPRAPLSSPSRFRAAALPPLPRARAQVTATSVIARASAESYGNWTGVGDAPPPCAIGVDLTATAPDEAAAFGQFQVGLSGRNAPVIAFTVSDSLGASGALAANETATPTAAPAVPPSVRESDLMRQYKRNTPECYDESWWCQGEVPYCSIERCATLVWDGESASRSGVSSYDHALDEHLSLGRDARGRRECQFLSASSFASSRAHFEKWTSRASQGVYLGTWNVYASASASTWTPWFYETLASDELKTAAL